MTERQLPERDLLASPLQLDASAADIRTVIDRPIMASKFPMETASNVWFRK